MSREITTTDQRPSAPKPSGSASPTHTLSMLVSNQPGVLMRICQIFARRGYNIDSLVVSQGRNPRFSRLTLGISGDPTGLDQIVKQCGKLVDVIHCAEHAADDSVVKELILVKMRVAAADRTELLQIIEHFNGKAVDLTDTSMIAMITGNTDKVDAALRLFSRFDVVETVRTGKVVMARGEQPT